MKYIIDTEICDNFHLPLEQFMYMFLLYHNEKISIEQISFTTVKKGFVNCNGFEDCVPISPTLTKEGCELVETILLNSEFREGKRPMDRFDRLAEKLREIYPAGKKPGTNYLWRDSRAIIAKRLKSLIKRYNVEFTDEQAIEATKKYVESFNGDYRYMQLLKYFISKHTVIDGNVEEVSQFLSYIENRDGLDEEFNTNWTNDLK